jgi:hypothetical protein
VLLVASCAPQLPLDGRAPPCPGTYALCKTSGICVPAGQELDERYCTQRMSIRQGGDGVLPVPHISPEQVVSVAATTTSKDAQVLNLPTDLRSDGGDGSLVTIHVPHGTPPSSLVAFATIVTRGGGAPFTRSVPLIISQIAVDPGIDHKKNEPIGNDRGPGTNDLPFHTLRQAAAVAGDGDSIQLHDSGERTLDEVPGNVTLPPNIYVKGLDPSMGSIVIPVALDLQGNAILEGVTFTQRLVLSHAGSVTSLSNVEASAGIALADTATNASLQVSGALKNPADSEGEPNISRYVTKIESAGTEAALNSQANGATITVSQASISSSTANVGAIRVSGHGQTFGLDDVFVTVLRGAPAMVLDGAQTVKMTNSEIHGRVELTAPEGQNTIIGTKFFWNWDSTGVLFQGLLLDVKGSASPHSPDSLFDNSPLDIDNPTARAVVRGARFADYTDYALRLDGGFVDLGTANDPGNNTFDKNPMASNTTALSVVAPLNGVNGISVSSTTFESVLDSVFPGQCTRYGIITRDKGYGIYEITNENVPIDFY